CFVQFQFVGCLTFREQTKLRVFRIYRETLSRFRAPPHLLKTIRRGAYMQVPFLYVPYSLSSSKLYHDWIRFFHFSHSSYLKYESISDMSF
ncbi:hypothetical protein AAHB56_01485, partial [Bacillus thuringiensis]